MSEQRRAVAVARAGQWDAARQRGVITLPFDQRYKRRLRMQDDAGEAFLLDLERATLMGDGDALELADGSGFLLIRAAVEPVAEIAPSSQQEAARLAWHIGNRHTPVQVLSDGRLRILHDPVLIHMLTGLGAQISGAEAPFSPEGGAYGGGGIGAGHSHGSSQGRIHEHPHSHDDHAHPHTHGDHDHA
ncbi:urease accessory protein UreE [Magnetofaba australis]|uniref:Urease accessory protein UreE n=1 Tax=Magnetofaba australis IT-1 TaxID=1434232 RepID=A0A1Y2K672_9PROT|nr:urease accessory protein UreE [Magnetofaba australis]OSM05020.1 putative UreE urease accessory domain-containing protein [Magnetofaba australis IT-1]